MLDLSIVIINKNYLRFLKKCINSCLNQITNFQYEIIVVDDGSNDGSVNFLRNIKNTKLSFTQTKSEGIEKAANKGFKKSRGKYVVRVDSDDYLHKNFAQNSLLMIKNSKKSFVYSDYFQISSNKNTKKKTLPNFDQKELINRGDFLATGTLFDKNIIKKLGYYNENTKNSGLENYELILKLIKSKYEGKKINKFLFYYRKHQKNLSIIKKKKIINYGKKIFSKMKLGKYSQNKYHPWH
tara:strand:+ start:724 stop:1440 length:717 start_codon:yes stop_codon:yes gene_type:complete